MSPLTVPGCILVGNGHLDNPGWIGEVEAVEVENHCGNILRDQPPCPEIS